LGHFFFSIRTRSLRLAAHGGMPILCEDARQLAISQQQ
jgi:hypothetical protein